MAIEARLRRAPAPGSIVNERGVAERSIEAEGTGDPLTLLGLPFGLFAPLEPFAPLELPCPFEEAGLGEAEGTGDGEVPAPAFAEDDDDTPADPSVEVGETDADSDGVAETGGVPIPAAVLPTIVSRAHEAKIDAWSEVTGTALAHPLCQR